MGKEQRKMIAKNLQAVRKAAGYKSARAFAEAINMEVSRYTEYEQGRVGFSYETAWIMADALRCSMDELGGREWPPGGRQQDLSDAERGLVSDYRSMDPGDRSTIERTARTFAAAAEKEGEEIPAPDAGGPASLPHLAGLAAVR